MVNDLPNSRLHANPLLQYQPSLESLHLLKNTSVLYDDLVSIYATSLDNSHWFESRSIKPKSAILQVRPSISAIGPSSSHGHDMTETCLCSLQWPHPLILPSQMIISNACNRITLSAFVSRLRMIPWGYLGSLIICKPFPSFSPFQELHCTPLRALLYVFCV